MNVGELVRGMVSCDMLLQETSGTRHQCIAEGKSYNRRPPDYVDDIACGSEAKARLTALFSSLYVHARDVMAILLPNATVFGQGTVVDGRGYIVVDSAAEFLNHGLAPDGSTKNGEDILINSERRRVLSGCSLLVKRPWYRNFGHWLVDLMPLLALIERSSFHVDRVLLGEVGATPLRQIMERCAKACLPNAEIVFLPDDEQTVCEELIFIRPVHVPPLFKSPVAIEAMVETGRRIFADGNSSTLERLLISRRGIVSRKIHNEEALVASLVPQGFTVVSPEHLSFDDQIALFSQAKIIVGVKGAALTNAAFCSPGTHLIVLSPPDFVDPFFWDLVSPRGLGYSEIFCKALGGEGGVSMQDIEVNIESVLHCLSQLLN